MISKKQKNFFFKFAIGCITVFYIWLVFDSLLPHLPTLENPILFYSNKTRQDLKITTLQAIKSAKKSIFIITFGLTDSKVIDLIQKKAKEHVKVKVYYDKRSSPLLSLPNCQTLAIKNKGLLHQKIIVIDNQLILMGSANLTPSSLSMHDNLIVGIYSNDLAAYIIKKAPFLSGHQKYLVEDQPIEIWLLPDIQNKALKRMIRLIKSAKNKIEVVMFTLTHPKLIHELILAKKRDVNVSVIIDQNSASGFGKNMVKKLKDNDIEVLLSRGPQLCHHKYLNIDNKTLVCGSANWTKSAFQKNYDCLLIIHDLCDVQQNFLSDLFQTLEKESSFLK